MSTPPPNASTPPTVPAPPVIPLPTTPIGAAQTLISLLSPPGASQGAQSAHSALTSLLQMSADAPVTASAPPPPPLPAPVPVPATQIAADPTDPGPASISSHGGREPTSPRGTARVTRSYPALPEPSHPPARPIPLPGGDGYRRLTAHYADSETAWQARDDGDPVRSPITAYVPSWLAADPYFGASSSLDQNREKSVALRLKSTIDAATLERDKAAQKGERGHELYAL